MMQYYLCIFLFLLFIPTSTHGAIYQWLDDQGNVGFTDNPENIPKKYRQSATQLDGASLQEKPKTHTTPSVPQSTDAPSDTAVLDDEGHDEVWWQMRVQELHHRKELLLVEKERLTTEMDPLGKLGLGTLEANQRAKEINERLEQIDSEIETIESDLTVVLPEEARKANAPPGWLRDER